MPRKSRDLRLSQTLSLIDQYATAGIGHADKSFRFMSDMVTRLDQGKSLSSGQRNYLDNLIDQGVPSLKNENRVNHILAAAEVDGMQEVAATLKDFAYKVGKGWSLSEKQESFLEKLLQKSEKLKVTGRYRPSSEDIEDLLVADAILRHKNGWYWQHRIGTGKAYDKVHTWLKWYTSKTALDNLVANHPEHSFQLEKEPIIDKWSCEKVLKTVKNQIHEIKNPRHLVGAMAWMKTYGASGKSTKALGLVSGLPSIQKGTIVYPFLFDGEDIMVPTDQLKKRR